jgi:hypothetical protein
MPFSWARPFTLQSSTTKRFSVSVLSERPSPTLTTDGLTGGPGASPAGQETW